MSNYHILLIEDDDMVVKSIKYSLEKAGHTVESTVSGRLGVQSALTSHPDLIICDLILPDINGAEVVSEIRGNTWGKDAKIVILTNISEDHIKQKLRDLKVERYLVKVENTMEQIIQAINEILTKIS